MTPTRPSLDLAIQFAVKAELPGRADFRRWAKAALRGDVAAALRIVDAEEGLALNRDYRGKDYATNVLTFEYGPDPETGALTGDIVLCAPVVAREAREQGKPLAEHYAHLTVHGVLHLLGWDHEDTREAECMERLEREILAGLGIADPYR